MTRASRRYTFNLDGSQPLEERGVSHTSIAPPSMPDNKYNKVHRKRYAHNDTLLGAITGNRRVYDLTEQRREEKNQETPRQPSDQPIPRRNPERPRPARVAKKGRYHTGQRF